MHLLWGPIFEYKPAIDKAPNEGGPTPPQWVRDAFWSITRGMSARAEFEASAGGPASEQLHKPPTEAENTILDANGEPVGL